MVRKGVAAVAAAALLLAGCAATGGAPRAPSSVAAHFSDPQAAPLVSAVDFVDGQHGWLGRALTASSVGESAGGDALFATSDGGGSWRELARTRGPILAIDFRTARQGFVVTEAQGHLELLRASDGGRTLRLLAEPAGRGPTVQLRFTSAQDGFLVAGGDLDVTSDGGRTWSPRVMSLPAVGREGATAAPDLLSASLGFLAENGGVYRTVDGGRTWTQVYRLPAALDGWGGGGAAGPVAFADGSLGYAVLDIPNCWAGGCPDVVLRTTDGGGTWQPVAYEMQGPLPGLAAVPSSGPPGGVGALAAWGPDGVAATTMSGLAVSSDGGTHWTAQWPGVQTSATFSLLAPRPGGGALAGGSASLVAIGAHGALAPIWPAPLPSIVSFVGPRTGFGLELEPEPQLLRTTDSGRTWAPVGSQPRAHAAAGPSSVAFADARHGWVAYAYGADAHAYATADGGGTWHALGPQAVQAVDPLAGGQGYLLTSSPHGAPELLFTGDGGRRFARRPLPRGYSGGGEIAFAGARTGFLVQGTTVWATRDGARTWRMLPLPSALGIPAYIAGLSADRAGELWIAVEPYGKTSREAIGVRSAQGRWRFLRLPGAVADSAYLQSLSAVSPSEAYLATPAGVFRTTDGGVDWRNVAWPAAGLGAKGAG